MVGLGKDARVIDLLLLMWLIWGDRERCFRAEEIGATPVTLPLCVARLNPIRGRPLSRNQQPVDPVRNEGNSVQANAVRCLPKRLRLHTCFDQELLAELCFCAWTCVKAEAKRAVGRKDVSPGMITGIQTHRELPHWQRPCTSRPHPHSDTPTQISALPQKCVGEIDRRAQAIVISVLRSPPRKRPNASCLGASATSTRASCAVRLSYSGVRHLSSLTRKA